MYKAIHLIFDGPFQHYGIASQGRFIETNSFPTRSSVTGLLGAAMGIHFNDGKRLKVLDGAYKQMVGLSKEGGRYVDFQTVSGTKSVNGKELESPRLKDVHYLVGYVFHVLLYPESEDIHSAVMTALTCPRFQLYLGKRNCLPARSVLEREVECKNREDGFPDEVYRIWSEFEKKRARKFQIRDVCDYERHRKYRNRNVYMWEK